MSRVLLDVGADGDVSEGPCKIASVKPYFDSIAEWPRAVNFFAWIGGLQKARTGVKAARYDGEELFSFSIP